MHRVRNEVLDRGGACGARNVLPEGFGLGWSCLEDNGNYDIDARDMGLFQWGMDGRTYGSRQAGARAV